MLKFINSSYRCLWLTCETSYYTCENTCSINIKSSLSCRRYPSRKINFSTTSTVNCYKDSNQQQRFPMSKIKNKKFSQIKETQCWNDLKKIKKKMSDSLQPSTSYVGHGGEFQVGEWYNKRGQKAGNSASFDTGSGSEGTNIWSVQNTANNKSHNSDFRKWEAVEKGDKKQGNSLRFKIVSYNVLAQCLLECHPYLYRKCLPYNLKWNVRQRIIYDEITKLSPDIICLQEVQYFHIATFYSKFEELGYYGIFKRRTGQRQDGCAIYFKKSMFSLESHMTVEFCQPLVSILNRDNIGIMAKLVPHERPDAPIVVATTHLLFNLKRTDVRLAQIQIFLAEIDRFSYCSNGKEPGHLPIILTGDFNSTPESSVIKLLDRGQVSAGLFRYDVDWRRIAVTDNCQHLSVYLSRQKGEAVFDARTLKITNSDYDVLHMDSNESDMDNEHHKLFNSDTLRHALKLNSVYDRVKDNGLSEATTFQDYWVTVDYIYYSRHRSLNLVERLRLPTVNECEVLGPLPNAICGSDHLMLGAVFEITPG